MAGQLIFHIITTNLEFSKWGSIFTDDQMAAAMIDRLAHHGQLIVFEGESYRLSTPSCARSNQIAGNPPGILDDQTREKALIKPGKLT